MAKRNLRPSRNEKSAYTDALAEALSHGRITQTMYDERMTIVNRAASFDELDTVVSDMPLVGISDLPASGAESAREAADAAADGGASGTSGRGASGAASEGLLSAGGDPKNTPVKRNEPARGRAQEGESRGRRLLRVGAMGLACVVTFVVGIAIGDGLTARPDSTSQAQSASDDDVEQHITGGKNVSRDIPEIPAMSKETVPEFVKRVKQQGMKDVRTVQVASDGMTAWGADRPGKLQKVGGAAKPMSFFYRKGDALMRNDARNNVGDDLQHPELLDFFDLRSVVQQARKDTGATGELDQLSIWQVESPRKTDAVWVQFKDKDGANTAHIEYELDGMKKIPEPKS